MSNWRRYHYPVSDIALAALKKGPLTLDKQQFKYVVGDHHGRAFGFPTIKKLIDAGLAEKRGDQVVLIEAPSIQPEESDV
jgi:hypothetical protein